MPDLTLEPYYYCSSVENFVRKGGDYTVTHGSSPRSIYACDWYCTCRGFKYHKTCKHVEQVKEELCAWDQFIDGGDPVESKCPNRECEVKCRMVGV